MMGVSRQQSPYFWDARNQTICLDGQNTIKIYIYLQPRNSDNIIKVVYTSGSMGTVEVRLDEFYYILEMQGKTGETPEEKPAKSSLPTTDL